VRITGSGVAQNLEYVRAYNERRRLEYAQERGPLERVCANPECAREFVAGRRDNMTCSQRCRDRLAYLRRRQRERCE